MSIKSVRDVEKVGWIFFLIMSVIMAPLGVWLVSLLTYASFGPYARAIAGILLGIVLAGTVSAAVNETLYRRHLNRQKARRKEEKRKKRG